MNSHKLFYCLAQNQIKWQKWQSMTGGVFLQVLLFPQPWLCILHCVMHVCIVCMTGKIDAYPPFHTSQQNSHGGKIIWKGIHTSSWKQYRFYLRAKETGGPGGGGPPAGKPGLGGGGCCKRGGNPGRPGWGGGGWFLLLPRSLAGTRY